MYREKLAIFQLRIFQVGVMAKNTNKPNWILKNVKHLKT